MTVMNGRIVKCADVTWFDLGARVVVELPHGGRILRHPILHRHRRGRVLEDPPRQHVLRPRVRPRTDTRGFGKRFLTPFLPEN